MKILIVNDDSIHAPGIQVLAHAAAALGDVYVVAPESQCSAMSQKLTIRDNLIIKSYPDFPAPVRGAWSVSGTPVDCVKVALRYMMLEEQPDLVLSGVNNGYNVGFDTAYSGTVGAALEAARSGVPAIALSTSHERHLPAVEPLLVSTIQDLLAKPLEPGKFWNVNFPALLRQPLQGVLWDRPVARMSMFCDRYEGKPLSDGTVELTNAGFSIRDGFDAPGTDAEAVRQGYISISKLSAY